jgi:hypothetical protein
VAPGAPGLYSDWGIISLTTHPQAPHKLIAPSGLAEAASETRQILTIPVFDEQWRTVSRLTTAGRARPDGFPTNVCSSSCSPAACPPCRLPQDRQEPLLDVSPARQAHLGL